MFFKFKKSFPLLCLLVSVMLRGAYVKAEDTIIVSGYSYDEGGPHIILCNIDKKEYHKQYLNGQMINLTKSGPRYCVGIYNLVDFSSSPCPYKTSLDPRSKINHCSDCYRNIGFNPSYYNATQISPQQLAYNETPHIVYLAYFSPTCVKVGTASLKRSNLRLLEQGAKAAFILKTFPNAYQARKLEEKIVNSGFGILEGVTEKQKADILCSDRYDPAKASSVLTEFLKLLKITPESSFLNLYPNYFYGTEVTLTYPDKTKLFSDRLVGEAVGMVGDMVIIRQKDRFFPITKFMIISVKNFISCQVNQ